MGTVRPVVVVADSDLVENGGNYVLEGGEAIPVVGVDASTTISKIIRGTRTPVYVVASTASRKGGTPIQMTVYDTGRGVEGRVAKPVYLVSGSL
jgi:hypothetical protein